MGAIGGEELMKWEKMQGVAAREEKILVLVRLRPLNEKEIAASEVADWECINNTTILYRNSLREGSTFPSAYTFDRVYPGDCSTREVYEEGAREIALSVVSGINSSIFAYGQTSSGKTYTMVGITEYTVADIFDYKHRHEERAFALKFSAIEIYNEAVRDLLSTDNTQLRLLDDPEKGTIVEKVTEETLRDWNHLKELLSICEAQRRIGETSLNEKSSRSHQILRLTIESSAREFLGKGNSTTLSASVNFIDLAGSERASQALSAGSRLKEGCHINRSLLTLSTVTSFMIHGMIQKVPLEQNSHHNFHKIIQKSTIQLLPKFSHPHNQNSSMPGSVIAVANSGESPRVISPLSTAKDKLHNPNSPMPDSVITVADSGESGRVNSPLAPAVQVHDVPERLVSLNPSVLTVAPSHDSVEVGSNHAGERPQVRRVAAGGGGEPPFGDLQGVQTGPPGPPLIAVALHHRHARSHEDSIDLIHFPIKFTPARKLRKFSYFLVAVL